MKATMCAKGFWSMGNTSAWHPSIPGTQARAIACDRAENHERKEIRQEQARRPRISRDVYRRPSRRGTDG